MKKADFTVNIDREGEIRILQLTDMQVIDAKQMRFPERLGGSSLVNWVPEKHYNNLYQYMDELVEMRNNGVIVTRSVLLENIWDKDGAFIDDNTLSVHISRLREKIGAEHIKTVRGIGYRWEN